jgi:hypothetical protein
MDAIVLSTPSGSRRPAGRGLAPDGRDGARGASVRGRRFEDFDAVREYLVQGTPFSLLYAIACDTVWIIDVRDQRGRRGAEAVRRFLRDFRVPGPGVD